MTLNSCIDNFSGPSFAFEFEHRKVSLCRLTTDPLKWVLAIMTGLALVRSFYPTAFPWKPGTGLPRMPLIIDLCSFKVLYRERELWVAPHGWGSLVFFELQVSFLFSRLLNWSTNFNARSSVLGTAKRKSIALLFKEITMRSRRPRYALHPTVLQQGWVFPGSPTYISSHPKRILAWEISSVESIKPQGKLASPRQSEGGGTAVHAFLPPFSCCGLPALQKGSSGSWDLLEQRGFSQWDVEELGQSQPQCMQICI